jgi:hypothetical protein
MDYRDEYFDCFVCSSLQDQLNYFRDTGVIPQSVPIALGEDEDASVYDPQSDIRTDRLDMAESAIVNAGTSYQASLAGLAGSNSSTGSAVVNTSESSSTESANTGN